MPRTLPLVLTALTASLATALLAPALVGTAATATEQTRAVAADRVATIDAFALLERALDLPEYAAGRDTLQGELQAQGSQFEIQIEKLNNELSVLVPGDPAINQKQTQLQSIYQQYQQFQQQAPMRFDALAAQQGSDVYWKIVRRAREIATERGYSHLLISRTKADTFVAGSVQQAMQEILARPVAMTPAGDDLTDALMQDMNLPQAPVVEDPAAGPEPAAPGTGG